ncbi:MAG: phosphomannomutase [Rhodobacteraceae bacterium]|nr:phosphomannomutase [Paracoccaceae bacterium]
MSASLTCFKAYDIRGRLGIDLDESIARRIGRAYGESLGARRVVLGRDIRASSDSLATAVAEGLMQTGAEVLDLGLCGTEEVYFATGHLGADGGICVTASHNPMDYNGMKLVQAGAAPLDPATTMAAIRRLAETQAFAAPRPGGKITDAAATRAAYVDRVLSFTDIAALRPLHVLVNCGNGAAGPTFDALATALAAKGAPLRFTRMHHDPDGSFPNGIPNPLLPENQPATAQAVIAAKADLGVAFDGDFDRCFFFDHEGRFVPGEYVVGLLAEVFCAKEPGATIIHDPRVILATQAAIARAGGRAVMARTGHAFLKQALRDTGAVYGGEMSAHHYFRDFYSCDSGMIPWLLLAELIGRTGQPLAALLADRRAAFPSSGEINFRVPDVPAAIARIDALYTPRAESRDLTDGLSLDFGTWRMNLRGSNTEPLLRLNVESRARPDLVEAAVAEITALLT